MELQNFFRVIEEGEEVGENEIAGENKIAGENEIAGENKIAGLNVEQKRIAKFRSCILNFGLSHSTLEEVFMKITKENQNLFR